MKKNFVNWKIIYLCPVLIDATGLGIDMDSVVDTKWFEELVVLVPKYPLTDEAGIVPPPMNFGIELRDPKFLWSNCFLNPTKLSSIGSIGSKVCSSSSMLICANPGNDWYLLWLGFDDRSGIEHSSSASFCKWALFFSRIDSRNPKKGWYLYEH